MFPPSSCCPSTYTPLVSFLFLTGLWVLALVVSSAWTSELHTDGHVPSFQGQHQGYFFFFFFFNFIYLFLFLAVLGLRFCARAFSICGERGPLFIAVCRPLTIVASLVAEHKLQTHRLSSCGSWAQLLRGMWDLPRPGLEPVSPVLAGRFSTTVPPGKPQGTSSARPSLATPVGQVHHPVNFLTVLTTI